MTDKIDIHFDALKQLVSGDVDLDKWKKQYPRTANAVLTGDPTSFDLPEQEASATGIEQTLEGKYDGNAELMADFFGRMPGGMDVLESLNKLGVK